MFSLYMEECWSSYVGFMAVTPIPVRVDPHTSNRAWPKMVRLRGMLSPNNQVATAGKTASGQGQDNHRHQTCMN